MTYHCHVCLLNKSLWTVFKSWFSPHASYQSLFYRSDLLTIINYQEGILKFHVKRETDTIFSIFFTSCTKHSEVPNRKWGKKKKNVSCLVTQSCPTLFATPWTAALQALLSMTFPRQEYWSGLPFLHDLLRLYHFIFFTNDAKSLYPLITTDKNTYAKDKAYIHK